jgi:iron complex outermembrane receptor protein
MIRKTVLLAGVASASLVAHAASAQGVDANRPATAVSAPTDTGTVPDPAPIADQATDQTPGDDIVVLGFGQSRQVQTVTAADLARLTPGTSPLKAASKLPGVNFQSADAFGAYEWSTRISLRGFNQNQLGFTLDGVPLGDMSYGNVNGLHISRAIISEDVAATTVAQGAGSLGTASTSNLGGTIQFTSRTPSDVAGIQASGTYGSNDTVRAFVRAESGDLGGGLKGYLSYGYLTTDKWKGVGAQRQHQADAKIVKDLGANGSLTAFFDFSDRRETDYQDLSLDSIRRLGLRLDNIGNNYPLAIRLGQVLQNQSAASTYAKANNGSLTGFTPPFAAAGLTFPAPYATVDDAYFDAGGLRRDYLGGATLKAELVPGLTLKSTVYYHQNKGQGSWITPYAATPVGAPGQNGQAITDPAALAFRTTEYSIHRGGNTSSLAYEAGINRFEIGGWYESNTFRQARRFYGMANGTTPNRATLQYQNNPFFTQWEGKYDTETMQYYVQDTLTLADGRLVLNGGWKGMQVKNRANLTTGTLVAGAIQAKDWFLPQAGFLFKLGGGAELFGTYTENMRAFVSSATSGPFSTTQVGFDAIKNTLKPETSKTVEGGVRVRSGGLQLSAAGYYIDFSNRLLGYQVGAGIVGNPVTLNNAGGVESYGAELTANYRIVHALSLFASYSYNHAAYQSTIANVSTDNNGVVTRTILVNKGDRVVDTPEHMAKGEIVYDDDSFIARAGVDWMAKRYFTYTNDQSVGGRALVDASIGYRFHGAGFLDGISIEGSVTNLTDKKYISTIGSNGFGASGDNQTLLAGAPRQWFVSLRKGF